MSQSCCCVRAEETQQCADAAAEHIRFLEERLEADAAAAEAVQKLATDAAGAAAVEAAAREAELTAALTAACEAHAALEQEHASVRRTAICALLVLELLGLNLNTPCNRRQISRKLGCSNVRDLEHAWVLVPVSTWLLPGCRGSFCLQRAPSSDSALQALEAAQAQMAALDATRAQLEKEKADLAAKVALAAASLNAVEELKETR